MSRTRKTEVSYAGANWRKKRKMKAYGVVKSGDQRGKFTPKSELYIGVTKMGKLVARNANRSLKKRARQHSKQLIKQG